jgi:hypothetical protein
MNTLTRYLELIVDPTFDEFHAKRDSIRLAFLTCVAIYHSIDRVAEKAGPRRAARQKWCEESVEFKLVEVIAYHFKHVKSSDEKRTRALQEDILRIGWALGFNDAGDTMDLRNLYFVIRDALGFVHRKAGTEHPALPEPSPRLRKPAASPRAFKTR